MIVCSCRVLTDQDFASTIVTEAPGCPRSAVEAYRCLGCGPDCGRCLRTIRQVLANARAAARCRDCQETSCEFHLAAANFLQDAE